MTGIKAVVVGTGFGARVHVPALRAAGFDIVGLVGTRPDRLARKAAEADVPAAFTDLDEAIDRTGATLVTIATPPATHYPLARAAIARGCHVLCEKPFAMDAAEARSLLEEAERAGVIHMVAHEFRWQPERAVFGRAIAGGLIGEPRFLAIDQFLPLCADPAARLPSWWFDEAAGGGWLGAGGSHLIDQIRALFGDVASVSANLFTVSDRTDGAGDSYSLRFRMRTGMEVAMQQSAGAWGPMATLWRCAGRSGTIWIDAGQVMAADATGVRTLPIPEELRLPPPAGGRAPFEQAAFVRLAGMLGAAIEGRTPPSPIAAPSFRDGLAVMEIMDAIRASSAAAGALQTL